MFGGLVGGLSHGRWDPVRCTWCKAGPGRRVQRGSRSVRFGRQPRFEVFARFDGLACAFVTFGRDAFFAGRLDFAGDLEFFFFAELAINWETPLVGWARAEAY